MTDEIKDKDDKIILAETIGLEPPIIKFYTKAISTLQDKDLKARIKRIISHEVAHVFSGNEEEACSHQDLNVFK